MNLSRITFSAAIALLACSTLLTAAVDHSWLHRVPEKERTRVNPYAGKPQAIAAGQILFEENCARCHGEDARGRRDRPSLRSDVVQHASDGELAWLLRNGYAWKGMPSWNSLPEQERWQVIAYLRSLGHEHEQHPNRESDRQ